MLLEPLPSEAGASRPRTTCQHRPPQCMEEGVRVGSVLLLVAPCDLAPFVSVPVNLLLFFCFSSEEALHWACHFTNNSLLPLLFYPSNLSPWEDFFCTIEELLSPRERKNYRGFPLAVVFKGLMWGIFFPTERGAGGFIFLWMQHLARRRHLPSLCSAWKASSLL